MESCRKARFSPAGIMVISAATKTDLTRPRQNHSSRNHVNEYAEIRPIALRAEKARKLNLNARAILKTLGLPQLLHPFRGSITWAFQRGILPSGVRRYFPWRWANEPFTIYGAGWKCRWFPTEFDIIGSLVFWRGLRGWEKETNPVILANIRLSRCFIDIGANTGMYTVLGCSINPCVRAVAVEPVPRICAALAHNVAMNNYDSRVTVLNVALSDEDGTVPFHEADEANMGSLAVEGYRGHQGKVILVKCSTLDSIVEELKIEPDFMKIDVEGFAHLVLGGGSWVLSKFRPRIVLEANVGDRADTITEILSKYGYAFQNITDSGLESRSEIVPVEAYPNWLCVPKN
jgi:FkbM family methyltransferase